VAGAFARFAAVVEQAGAETLAPEVRALVTGYLASWRGEDPGLGRTWVERLVGTLAEAQRPAARLALLAAVASYQVDDATSKPSSGCTPVTMRSLACWPGPALRPHAGSAPGSPCRQRAYKR
jgi:hypothetical protein